MIAGVAAYFTLSQADQQRHFQKREAKQQRYIQKQEAMEASLQTYLDQMTDMMLDDKPLLKSKPHSARRATARVLTITALKRLDNERNKVVLSFLKESGLLLYRVPGDPKESVVELVDADLSGVELAGTNLSGVNLRFVNLRGAHLQNAKLGAANLAYADLTNANLEGADLRDADLLFANLQDANLKGANFTGANPIGANVEGAIKPEPELPSQNEIDQDTELGRVDMLGAALAPLEAAKPDIGKIGIPEDVGRTIENGEDDIYGTLVSYVDTESPAEAIGFQSGDHLLENQHKNDKMVFFAVERRYFNKGWRQVTLGGKLGN